MAEQLICNQQVDGSTPFTSSIKRLKILYMGEFPSGQRGQTVNLLLFSFGGPNPPSPTKQKTTQQGGFLFGRNGKRRRTLPAGQAFVETAEKPR